MLIAAAMTNSSAATDPFIPEIRFVDTPRVACDGDEGPLGHPRVYMQIDEHGFVDCGYCDRRFILTGSVADTRDNDA